MGGERGEGRGGEGRGERGGEGRGERKREDRKRRGNTETTLWMSDMSTMEG